MEEVTEEFGAKAETIVFLDRFRELPDPRQRGKVLYPLDEILQLCLLAVLAGAETFVDIALFGQMKLEFLRRFRPFRDSTPAIFLPRSMPGNSSGASPLGSHRRREYRSASSPSMGSRRAVPTRRRTPRLRSTWSRPSPPASVSCSDRSRWRKSRSKSSRFPSSSTGDRRRHRNN